MLPVAGRRGRDKKVAGEAMILHAFRADRRGYTLVELLMVVALLAAVLGLGLPALGRFSEKGELLNAAQQLRAELLSARLTAIESGHAAWFHYQPGGRTYVLLAVDQQADPRASAESLASPNLDVSPQPGLASTGDSGDDAAAVLLPSGIRFDDSESSESTSAFAASGEASEVPADVPAGALDVPGGAAADVEQTAGGGVPVSIAFYPNGRALNARISLASKRYRIGLTVRGLTGTVQIAPVQRIEETTLDALEEPRELPAPEPRELSP